MNNMKYNFVRQFTIFLLIIYTNEIYAMKVTIVIDVFRAFTTASYILDKQPASYILTDRQSVVCQLAVKHINPIIIGKPEKGLEGRIIYHIPNSPTRLLQLEISNRDIIHRTAAGAKGILFAKDADVVLAAGFVNAAATANYVKGLTNAEVTILPMGHEGTTPSQEDDLCAKYIEALINEETIELDTSSLKEGSGRYFFAEDQWQYPQEDFQRCLEVDRFNFAIQATVQDDYAILVRCY